MEQISPVKISTIPIYPSTNVRSTQGDRWLFAVTDEYLEEYDKKRLETHGRLGRNLTRKRQLEKYNAYKEEIRYWAEKNKFTIPTGYFSIWFHVPYPKSWRGPKIKQFNGAPHTSTPDLDNMLKALFDGLMPRRNRISGGIGADDRKIHSYSAFKVWCTPGEERIVVVEYKKEDFLKVFEINTT